MNSPVNYVDPWGMNSSSPTVSTNSGGYVSNFVSGFQSGVNFIGASLYNGIVQPINTVIHALVSNNPINFIDPYGLSAKDAFKGLHFGIRATGAVTTEVARIVARDVAVATTSAYINIPFAVGRAMTGMSTYGDFIGLGEVGTRVSERINAIRDEMYNERSYERPIPEIHNPRYFPLDFNPQSNSSPCP